MRAKESPLSEEKRFFRIGEVSEIVGERPHVLRYWESEFPEIRPKKTRGSHRHYTRRDIDFLMEIKRLLRDEGFSVEGAKQRLREARREANKEERPVELLSDRETALRLELIAARDALYGILDLLDSKPQVERKERPARVVVQEIKRGIHANSSSTRRR